MKKIAAALVLVAAVSAVVSDVVRTQERDEASARGQGRGRGRGEGVERARERLRRLQETARERRAARVGPGVIESVTHTARIGGDGSVDLANVAGRVSVTGRTGDEMRLEAVKRAWHRDPDQARALLDQLEVRVSEGAGRVDVRTIYPQGQSYDAEVDYMLSVPHGTRVSIRGVSGDIAVTGVQGELRAVSIDGAINVTSAGDVRLLRSVSGSVLVEGVAGTDLTASTVGGSVTARKVKARTVDLRSVSGTLRVLESESDRVTMQTVGGAIEYAGRIGQNGRYDLRSRTGQVSVTPAGNDGFEVDVVTVDGRFRSDFPLTLRESRRPGTRGPGGRGGLRRGTAVSGTFGDGGGLLTLRSATGEVTIRRP
jgi:hypothetical protein